MHFWEARRAGMTKAIFCKGHLQYPGEKAKLGTLDALRSDPRSAMETILVGNEYIWEHSADRVSECMRRQGEVPESMLRP